ncbi:MAG: Na/Pi cotransporter family protein [Victivallaceae bacterium]|nr:Na/Pi cotransporter family protein [Victivallaceae bacterium]
MMNHRMVSRAGALLLALVFVLVAGCSKTHDTKVSRINVLRGGDQCAAACTDFSAPLFLEVRSADGPLSNIPLVIKPAPDSDLSVEPARVVSDAGGAVSVRVRAGKKLGDQYLIVTPENAAEPALRVRFVCGAEICGDQCEGTAGSVPREPVCIHLSDAEGKPLVGVPVVFPLTGTAEGAVTTAKIQYPRTFTDAEGNASTRVRLGRKTGAYRLNIDVDAPEHGCRIRGKQITLMGIDPLHVAITVIGGLAIFIFGMQLMSTGLKNCAGENMRKILQFFASNRVVALFAGIAVTAVLQSSSATSVMAVGFINAGLLTLKQALGIIFGASIGTTVMAQIISFNLSALALPAVIIGVMLILSSHRKVRNWGSMVLGFGMLFFGMTMMSSELKILGEMPTLQNAFHLFDCAPKEPGKFMPFGAILGAVLIGIVVTIIIQSSGAFAGIVLALASGGLINFYTSMSMLLGANIGTTITAILAAIPGNRIAKQAALAHTIFKIVSAALMIALFYVPWGEERIPVLLAFSSSITPGNPFAAVPQNIERHIAMAYTVFNIVAAVGMLPFLEWFVHIANLLLPIRNDEGRRTRMLEPVLLNTPSIALKLTTQAIQSMVIDAWKMIEAAVNEHFIGRDDSPEKLAKLEAAEEDIDARQKEVTDYLVRLTRRQLTVPQSELVPHLMHCTNDAERIADHCETVIGLSERLRKEQNPLSETALTELRRVWSLLDQQAKHVVSGLEGGGPEVIRAARTEGHEVGRLADRFESEHIERLREGRCSPATGVIYIEMLGEITKISARLSNIADRTPEIEKHYVKL